MWIHLSVNPDPWAIGPLGVGKRNGKYFPYVGRNTQLHAFKEAVREELELLQVKPVPYDTYALKFFFWRRLDSHAGGKKHVADATNMQKALEDALQEVLIGNDRDVRDIQSVIVEQGSDVKPSILIHIDSYGGEVLEQIPDDIWETVENTPEIQTSFNNTWNGPPT